MYTWEKVVHTGISWAGNFPSNTEMSLGCFEHLDLKQRKLREDKFQASNLVVKKKYMERPCTHTRTQMKRQHHQKIKHNIFN